MTRDEEMMAALTEWLAAHDEHKAARDKGFEWQRRSEVVYQIAQERRKKLGTFVGKNTRARACVMPDGRVMIVKYGGDDASPLIETFNERGELV
jgi:hypothetical protein